MGADSEVGIRMSALSSYRRMLLERHGADRWFRRYALGFFLLFYGIPFGFSSGEIIVIGASSGTGGITPLLLVGAGLLPAGAIWCLGRFIGPLPADSFGTWLSLREGRHLGRIVARLSWARSAAVVVVLTAWLSLALTVAGAGLELPMATWVSSVALALLISSALCLLWLSGQLLALRWWSLPLGVLALVSGAAAFFGSFFISSGNAWSVAGLLADGALLVPVALGAALCALLAAIAARSADGESLLQTIRTIEIAGMHSAIGDYTGAMSVWSSRPKLSARARRRASLRDRRAFGAHRLRYLARHRAYLVMVILLAAGSCALAVMSLGLMGPDVLPVISASVLVLLSLVSHAMWQFIGQGFGQVAHLVKRRPVLGWGAVRATWVLNWDLLMLLVIAVVGLPLTVALLGPAGAASSHPVSLGILASLVVSAALISWTDANIDRGPRMLTASIPTPFGDLAGAKVLLESFRGWVYALGSGVLLWFGLEHLGSGGWWLIVLTPLGALAMFIAQFRLSWNTV